MGDKWMDKEFGQERVNSHWQADHAWSPAPPWGNINVNERTENGSPHYVGGREI